MGSVGEVEANNIDTSIEQVHQSLDGLGLGTCMRAEGGGRTLCVGSTANMRGMRGRHTDGGNDVCSAVGDSRVVDAELHAELEAGVDVLELLEVLTVDSRSRSE